MKHLPVDLPKSSLVKANLVKEWEVAEDSASDDGEPAGLVLTDVSEPEPDIDEQLPTDGEQPERPAPADDRPLVLGGYAGTRAGVTDTQAYRIAKVQLEVHNLSVTIPAPCDAPPSIATSHGQASYSRREQTVTWYACRLHADYTLITH